jgi:hypothetical protein
MDPVCLLVLPCNHNTMYASHRQPLVLWLLFQFNGLTVGGLWLYLEPTLSARRPGPLLIAPPRANLCMSGHIWELILAVSVNAWVDATKHASNFCLSVMHVSLVGRSLIPPRKRLSLCYINIATTRYNQQSLKTKEHVGAAANTRLKQEKEETKWRRRQIN